MTHWPCFAPPSGAPANWGLEAAAAAVTASAISGPMREPRAPIDHQKTEKKNRKNGTYFLFLGAPCGSEVHDL